MTNEELTELCTRVAAKVLGWEIYSCEQNGDLWVDSDGKNVPYASKLYRDGIDELASPWGRDLIEKAMEEKGFKWSLCCSVYKQGKLKIYDYEFGDKGTVNHEDKNIACLLAANKAVSDD